MSERAMPSWAIWLSGFGVGSSLTTVAFTLLFALLR